MCRPLKLFYNQKIEKLQTRPSCPYLCYNNRICVKLFGINFRMDESNKSDHIVMLESVEHVRLRPKLYFGGTDSKAFYQFIFEALDTCIGEALSGQCTHIAVTLKPDGVMIIEDNGLGFASNRIIAWGMSWLEADMTRYGTGSRLRYPYSVAGGYHGVDMPAVNALSEHMTVEVKREGKLFRQSYTRGYPTAPVEEIRELAADESTGTKFTFLPDATIFETIAVDFDILNQRLQEVAFLLPNVTLQFRDERTSKEIVYHYPEGIVILLRTLKPTTGEVVYIKNVFNLDRYSAEVEIAYQFSDDDTLTEVAFCNSVANPDGGTHLDAFREFMAEHHPNGVKGLTVVIHIKHPEPQYESQAILKLMNPDVYKLVRTTLEERLG